MVRAVETNLQEVFEGSKQYQVPLYQRRYSWTSDQLQRLWDDIRSLAESRRLGSGDTHFIGSLVLAPGANVGPVGISEYLVVDGQQRLTSLSVLLCALRDHRAETEDPVHTERLNEQYLINKWKPDALRLKFKPTQADLAAYLAVLDSTAVADGSDGIGAAYRFFRQQLAQFDDPDDDGDIEAVEEAVISGLSVVSVTAQAGDNVHRIFESLNNTGMRLTQADLLRNYIFMRLPTTGEDVYRTVWLPMQDLLTNDELEMLFWLDLVTDDPRIRQTGTYAAQQRRMNALQEEGEIAAEVARVAQLATLLTKILHPESETVPEVRRRLQRLQRWGSTTVNPALLVLLDHRATGRASSQDIAHAMHLIESFLVRRLVVGRATNNLNKIMLGMAQEIRDTDDPVQAVHNYLSSGRKYFATDDQIRTAARTVPFYLNGRAPQRKQILAWLDEAQKPAEPLDTASTTIEHILPQTPTPTWRATIREDLESGEVMDDVYQSLVHLIGNLTLTVDNSSLGNGPFPTKKKKLADSRVLLNKDVVDQPRWGRPQILARSSALAEAIIGLWPGPLDTADVTESGVDWATMSRALASLPAGTWTTYGDLAALIGSHPVPVAGHLATKPVHNAHRVLTASGRVADGFRWLDPSDQRDPLQMLQEEGIVFDDAGVASDHQRIRVNELAELAGLDEVPGEALVLPEGQDPALSESFLEQLRADQPETVVHGVIALMADWGDLGGYIDYGTAGTTSAFLMSDNAADSDSATTTIWPLAIYPTGSVEVVFQHLARRPPFDDLTMRDAFRRRLNAIPGIDLPEGKLSMRPGFDLALLAQESVREALVDDLKWFLEQLRADQRGA